MGTTCNTGKQRGGTRRASAGDSISQTGKADTNCTKAIARRIKPTSPATKQPWVISGASHQARATISGPIPQGSPGVMAMGRAKRGAVNKDEVKGDSKVICTFFKPGCRSR
jgi:hypothetical protein